MGGFFYHRQKKDTAFFLSLEDIIEAMSFPYFFLFLFSPVFKISFFSFFFLGHFFVIFLIIFLNFGREGQKIKWGCGNYGWVTLPPQLLYCAYDLLSSWFEGP